MDNVRHTKDIPTTLCALNEAMPRGSSNPAKRHDVWRKSAKDKEGRESVQTACWSWGIITMRYIEKVDRIIDR